MNPVTEYDAAWKATLETFLPACLAISFPALADLIDWSAPPRFLDTELQEIVRDSESRTMRVDKLVEVMRLIHWLLALPEEEELGFRKDVKQMEASMQIKRRSTYERIVWEEGVEAGLERGKVQGRDAGLLEGRSEGRLEGRHTAARDVLLDLLGERFGPCSDGLRTRICAIRDEDRLRLLARAVLTVPTLREFEARIDG